MSGEMGEGWEGRKDKKRNEERREDRGKESDAKDKKLIVVRDYMREGGRKRRKDRKGWTEEGRRIRWITVMKAWTSHDKQGLMKTVVSSYLIHGVVVLVYGTCF